MTLNYFERPRKIFQFVKQTVTCVCLQCL